MKRERNYQKPLPLSEAAEELQPKRGGFRPGAGRPAGERTVMLSVRISQQAMDILNSKTGNKSEYIDGLIKQQ